VSKTVLLQYPGDNIASEYATIGVQSGTEDGDYPAAYLVDGRLARPAKLTTTSGAWVIEFANARRVDVVALGPHNLQAVTIEANATNVWTSPAFSAALTISAVSHDGQSVNAWRDLTGVTGYSESGFKYWRIVVSGAWPCALGEIWLGEYKRTPDRTYQWGWDVEETHATISHLTEFLVPHVYALGSRQRRMRVNFRATDAGAAVLLNWYRAMKGPGLTGLFVPDASVAEAWWVRQAEDYAENAIFTDARDVSMTLVEHATGVPL
jgi:hypothetical protein